MSTSKRSDPATSALEDQARHWLWAFPRWTRPTVGEETVGIVVDLCPPETIRLPIASRIDLVRAGFHVRRREIPPWRVWFTVLRAWPSNRVGMVPERWRPWLARRLPTASFLWWCAILRMMMNLAPIELVLGLGVLTGGGYPGVLASALLLVMLPVGATVHVLVHGPKWRSALRDRNALGATGAPSPIESLSMTSLAPRVPNVAAVWPLIAGGAASVFASLVNVADVGFGSDDVFGRWIAFRVVATLVGPPVLIGWWAAHALRRRDPYAESSVGHPVEALDRTWWRWPARAIVAYLAPTVLTFPFTIFSTFTLGSIGVAAAFVVVLSVVLVRQHRTGRRVGIWDLVPALGPVPRLIPIDRPAPPA